MFTLKFFMLYNVFTGKLLCFNEDNMYIIPIIEKNVKKRGVHFSPI